MHDTGQFLDRAVELAEALARLESVATLYAADHLRSQEAGERVARALRDLCGDEGPISLECAQGRLSLCGRSLSLEHPAIEELHGELDRLGILRLEVHRSATTEELHQLACRLRMVSQRLSSTRTLQSIDFGDLPPTIRVRHREFGRRVGGGAAAGSSRARLPDLVDSACRPMEQAGLDDDARATCRQWVDRSMHRVVECVEKRMAPSGTPLAAEAQRALEDVLLLAGQTLEHALADFLKHAAGTDDLQQMFRSIEQASAVCDDPESARLMLESMGEAAKEVLGAEPLASETSDPQEDPDAQADLGPQEEFQFSLEELHRRLEALKPSLKSMANLEREDRSEVIAILLTEVGSVESDAQASRCSERLAAVLQGPRTHREERTMLHALGALLACGNEHALDRALPAVAAALGDEATEAWLRPAVDCASNCVPGRLAPLWPHLANQVLLGPRFASEMTLTRAVEQLARLPAGGMPLCMMRLAGLSALSGGKVSRFAFEGPREGLTMFYAALLRSPHAELAGQWLLESLKANPPPWNGGVVFQGFVHCDAACRELLYDLARRGSLREAEAPTRAEAVRVLARRILTLSVAEAEEAWVVPAIEALAAEPGKEGLRALRRILDERRHLLLSAWPAACRQAAARALKSIERARAA